MPPTSDEQIQFLVKLQRLLDEGLFVASYKFALLLALADLSIEAGDDSGRPLPLTTEQIAGKFIQFYWRQAAPYVAPAEARVLQQNTGKQAAVVNLVEAARKDHGDSLAALINKAPDWKPLMREVAGVVRVMPLWKLQTVGQERLDFLYANTGTGKTIILHPGVAYCFRKFHSLIADLVRGAWARYVRQQNVKIVGEITDLHEFLFGSERAPLAGCGRFFWTFSGGGVFTATARYNLPTRTSIISWPGHAIPLISATTLSWLTAGAMARNATGSLPVSI
jgi:hypothetical protein